MNATTRPLPPHGSYARASGSRGYRDPCNCQPCLTTKRARKKLARVNRQLGRPNLVNATPARRHLNQLHQTMSWSDLRAATGCAVDTLAQIISGRRTQILRTTSNRILTVQPGQTSDGITIDATGTRRRLQALQAMRYTLLRLAGELETSEEHVRGIINGQPTVRKSTADRAAAAYRRLATKPGTSDIAARRAHALGWPPPLAWGDDIDDPQAHPDWTGHCGTHRGWHMHILQNLPMCQRCQHAHDEWADQHRHLAPQQRGRLLLAERQTSAGRGHALAEDARELMRQGHTREQAADRLGITYDNLGTILRRYPDGQQQEGAAA